ncbi:MAG: hypothetical protein SNG35_04305 [Rikenellaceae bacterium]
MRRIYIILLALVVAVIAVLICFNGGNRIVIKGDIVSCDEMMVYLYRSEAACEQQIIDSMRLSNRGHFRFAIDDAIDELTFYEVVCGWERVPLLLRSGDKVTVESAGSVSLNYKVSGSEESEHLRRFFQPYIKGSRELRLIATQYAVAQYKEEPIGELTLEYNSKYREIKQTQMRYIVENKERLASLYALAQRLPGDEFIFEESSDLIYMRIVADGIEMNYPSSPYISVLRGDIERAEQRLNLKVE